MEAYSMIKRSVQQMKGTPIVGDGIQGVSMKLLVGKQDDAPTFAMRHFSVEPGDSRQCISILGSMRF